MTIKTDCTVEKFSIGFVIFRIMLMLTVFGFGTYILFSIGKWFIVPFGILGIVLFLYILHTTCRHCYYYCRRCDLGLGKLASLICKSGGLNKDLYVANAKKSIPWLSALLLSPAIAGIIVLMFNYTVIMLFKVIGYIFLICLFLLTGFLLACPRCKMNKICPASIYKDD